MSDNLRDYFPADLLRGRFFFKDPPPPLTTGWYVLQLTRRGSGRWRYTESRDLQIRAYHFPADPKTAAQLRRRALFALAVWTWQQMTIEQREWIPGGQYPKNLPNYQLWMSYALRGGLEI